MKAFLSVHSSVFCWGRSCCRSLFLSVILVMKILRPGLCGFFCKSREHGSECSWDALGVCIMHRCTDIVLVMWSNTFFCVLLLLPSGLGDVPIETLTDFRGAESKSLRRKWTHKGSTKYTAKPEIWHLESFHCSDKVTVVCCCCFLTPRQTGCTHYLYISHLHDVFHLVISLLG